MKNLFPIYIIVALMLVVDFYAFKSLRVVSAGWSSSLRTSAFVTYGLSSVISYAIIIYTVTNFTRDAINHINYFMFYMGFGVLVLILIPKIVIAFFHLLDDIVNLFKWLSSYFFSRPVELTDGENNISRWQFISRMGWVLAAIPFASILYGMVRGRYTFRVLRETLTFSNFPATADGLKVVHISDIHIGSFFNNHKAVQHGVDMVNDLNPDIIVFTGDLVNNFASETNGWDDVLGGLKAKYGKYSILGNHDYGDYSDWPSASAKKDNLDKLKAYHATIGFKLLLNEWIPFTTGNGEKFEIIGVENWGEGGFSKYGNLAKAMQGTNPDNFQLLLSHDPSHWDAEVRRDTAIDLTVSGHTHGMQFGVEIPGVLKWSPAKYRYPRWGGLYAEGKQMLYVNRGFGYLGFPGRVGMPPEITLIELRKGEA